MIQFSLHTVYGSDDVFSALLCHPYCMLLCLIWPIVACCYYPYKRYNKSHITPCRARFDVWWFWSCWSLFFAISLKSSRFGTIWTRGSYSTRRQQLYCVQWRTGSIGTCQRGERGLRGAKVSPACNICDQFNSFICLFLEQMLWRCTRLAERNLRKWVSGDGGWAGR